MTADQVYGAAAAAFLAAASVVCFAAGLRHYLRRRLVDAHIRLCLDAEPPPVAVSSPRGQPLGQPSGQAGPTGLTERRASPTYSQYIHRRLSRSSYGAMVKGRLNRASLARNVSEVVIVQVGLGGLLALGGLVARPAGPLLQVVVTVVLGAIGFVAPLLWLDRRAASRVRAFEQQLPQAIDAMASTLQAGSSLQQAMAILAREMPPPISAEFQRVLREAEMGLSFPDSLAELSRRVPSADLVIFTRVISIQQRIGGDLATIFRVISHTIRERLRIRDDTKTLTTQGRYSSYVIGGLPVALFLFMWVTNYSYLSGLFQPGLPRILLGAGIGGMVLGFYSMNKVASVDV